MLYDSLPIFHTFRLWLIVLTTHYWHACFRLVPSMRKITKTYSQCGFKRLGSYEHHSSLYWPLPFISHEYSAFYLTTPRKVHGMRFPVCVGSGKASAPSWEWKAPPLTQTILSPQTGATDTTRNYWKTVMKFPNGCPRKGQRGSWGWKIHAV